MKFYFFVPWIVNFTLRLSVGLSLLIVGMTQYRDFEPFKASALDGIGGLWSLGLVWTFLLPGLLILSGSLLVYGRAMFITAWMGGLALGSVPVGLLLKSLMSGQPLPDTLMAATLYLPWLLLFFFAVSVPDIPPPAEGEE
mgnify:FL=1